MERKLLRDLKRPFKLEGFTRIDETPVHKAVREALANCIANADFNFPRGIVIKKDLDSLIIENPGSIITGKAQMLKGGISEPRNKVIMKMFNLIRVGERAGSGVPDIFHVWNDEGWAEPIVEEQYKPDRTILKLSFVSARVEKSDRKKVTERSDRKKETEKNDRKKVTEKTQVQKELILNKMQPNTKYKVEEVAAWLDVGRTRTRSLLKLLVDDGKVSETGMTKMKRYQIVETRGIDVEQILL